MNAATTTHFYEVSSEGGGVVLGEMTQQAAEGLAQGYADLWQCETRLAQVPFIYADDHLPWPPECVLQIAEYQATPLTQEERNEVLLKLQPWRVKISPQSDEGLEPQGGETLEPADHYEPADDGHMTDEEHRDYLGIMARDRLRELVGRAVVVRIAAFQAATAEAQERDISGVANVLKWLREDLSADDFKELAAETSQTLDWRYRATYPAIHRPEDEAI